VAGIEAEGVIADQVADTSSDEARDSRQDDQPRAGRRPADQRGRPPRPRQRGSREDLQLDGNVAGERSLAQPFTRPEAITHEVSDSFIAPLAAADISREAAATNAPQESFGADMQSLTENSTPLAMPEFTMPAETTAIESPDDDAVQSPFTPTWDPPVPADPAIDVNEGWYAADAESQSPTPEPTMEQAPKVEAPPVPTEQAPAPSPAAAPAPVAAPATIETPVATSTQEIPPRERRRAPNDPRNRG
jgi:hypothetical protein